MHRLLRRQVARHLGKDFDISLLSAETAQLLEDVSKSYDELYDEKKFLEHTIDVNSYDLEQASKKIVLQNKDLQILLNETSDENKEMVHLLKQYKEAIDASLIVSTTDTTGKIKYVNDYFCKVSGYTKEELIGQPHSIVRHPKNEKKFFKQMWETILNKKVFQGIFPNLAKDGSTYYVSATIVPLLNIDGEIVEFMALREDITKTIEYQNNIKAQQQRVSQIFDNQESIVALLDRDNGVVEVNRKFLEVFNFPSINAFKTKHSCVCELFEERENFLQPSDDDDLWFYPLIYEPEKVHLALINKRVYSVKIALLRMDNHETFLATFTDITEIEEARIKSHEAEKEKSNFLANMSHEIRTPMNAILGFSQLLERTELNTRQTKFVELIKNSSVTLIHIINDILDFSKLESGHTSIDLVSINPFMEFEETIMLLSQRAKEKHISYMIKIDHNIEECIEMDSFHIKQILVNLIGNAIKFTPKEGTVDIRLEKQIVDDCNIIRFSVQDTGIGIPKNRQEKIFEPFSQADSSTTRQFGGTGLGLSISNSLVLMLGSKLYLESEEGVGSKFYFDIKYNSCVSSHTLKSHLSKFKIYIYEVEEDFLYNISKQLHAYKIEFEIINEYNENIDLATAIVISTSEKATQKFQYAKVLLLSSTSTVHEDQRHHNVELFEEFPSLLYNELMRLKVINTDITSTNENKNLTLKILVAEDYDINRILISELLNQFDIDYSFALNGQEAVDMVKENSYDLILMDINMPIMNGIDASKIIINELKVTTPIVALTANALEGDKERFLSIGMVDYLSKPIDIKAFESLLVKYNNASKQDSIVTLSPSEDTALEPAVNAPMDIKTSLSLAAKRMDFPEAIIQSIFISYVESLGELEKNIEDAINMQDFAKIQMNAHNLKSGAASLCFDTITQIAQELETSSKNKDETFAYEAKFKEILSYSELLKAYLYHQTLC